MNKSTKILLTTIGALSISVGIVLFFYENGNTNAYFSIFVGVSLIAAVYFIQPMHEKKLEKEKLDKKS